MQKVSSSFHYSCIWTCCDWGFIVPSNAVLFFAEKKVINISSHLFCLRKCRSLSSQLSYLICVTTLNCKREKKGVSVYFNGIKFLISSVFSQRNFCYITDKYLNIYNSKKDKKSELGFILRNPVWSVNLLPPAKLIFPKLWACLSLRVLNVTFRGMYPHLLCMQRITSLAVSFFYIVICKQP